MSAGQKIIAGLEQAALLERIRCELFANLSHYRQRCIDEIDDARTVAKFIEAEINRRFFSTNHAASDARPSASGTTATPSDAGSSPHA